MQQTTQQNERILNRANIQRLNRLQSQVAAVDATEPGWRSWVVINPYIDDFDIREAIDNGISIQYLKPFDMTPLLEGLPRLRSSRLELEHEVIEPRLLFRIRWFEVEEVHVVERNYDLDGDEDFIVSLGDERVNSIEEVELVLSQWFSNPPSFDYPDSQFPL